MPQTPGLQRAKRRVTTAGKKAGFCFLLFVLAALTLGVTWVVMSAR
jgi:hypothetical protein